MDFEQNAMTIDIWHACLEECSFGECKHALAYWIEDNRFAPQISDIKRLVAKMRDPEAFKSSDQAWREVSQAASKFGFHGQSEAYKTLCEKTKRVLKTVKWWDICYSERPEITKNHFCKAWDNITESERELGRLPLHRALLIAPNTIGEQLPPKKANRNDLPKV